MMVRQRDAVVGGGPEHAGGVVEIPVALDIDAEAAVLPVGQRRAYRGGSAVADARRTLGADVLVVLREVPEFGGPGAQEEADVGDERPVFGADLIQISADMRAVEMGLESQPMAASERFFSCSFLDASTSFTPRSLMARRRLSVSSRFTASMSAGRVASASAAITTSASGSGRSPGNWRDGSSRAH